MNKLALLGLVLGFAACADKIGPSPNDNPDAAPVTGDGGGDGPLIPTGKITTVANADGSSTSLVDSSSQTEFVWVSLPGFAVAEETDAWALRFQRFRIAMGAGVEVAPLVGADFNAVNAVPTEGFMPDPFDTDPRWYDYDAEAHVLTPRQIVFVVKSPTAAIKLKIDKYYDTAGSAGWFTVTWRSL